MKGENLVNKAIKKVYDDHENDTDLQLIKLPFLEGLSGHQGLNYAYVKNHNKEITNRNKLSIEFLGFKSFEDMYLLAVSNENESHKGTPVTIPYFKSTLDLVVPEETYKATMGNSMSVQEKDHSKTHSDDESLIPTEVSDSISLEFTGESENRLVTLPNYQDSKWNTQGMISKAKGTQYLVYYRNSVPCGIVSLVNQDADYIVSGWSTKDNLEIRIISDLVVKAIKNQFKVILNAKLFSDKVPPFLIGMGYTKQSDDIYVYSGENFPEYLKVVIDNVF